MLHKPPELERKFSLSQGARRGSEGSRKEQRLPEIGSSEPSEYE